MPQPHSVALLFGEDEFLLRESARELLESWGIQGAREVDAKAWQGGETSDLATPSLWGERRTLLVTGCQSLSEAGSKELRSYVASPAPDALCVMTFVSRAKAAPALAKLVRSAGGLIKQVALKRSDLPKWVMRRARDKGLALSGPGAATLVEAIGEDLAALDQSVEQLAGVFPRTPVGPEQVRAQFQGLGEQRVWDLCDAAFFGRAAESLVVLRSLLDANQDPLFILGAVASRIRDLLRVQGLPEGMAPAEAAQAAGVRFEWQFRRYRDQAKRFTPAEMLALHQRVVEADRGLKAGTPGDLVLIDLVRAMAGGSEPGLRFPSASGWKPRESVLR